MDHFGTCEYVLNVLALVQLSFKAIKINSTLEGVIVCMGPDAVVLRHLQCFFCFLRYKVKR